MKKFLNCYFIFLIIAFKTSVFAQTLTSEEKVLYNLLMQYRAQMGLPEIPLSPSLTIVAKTHVKDLAINNPDRGNCNLHSWSATSTWSSCCYTANHAQAKCMWNKPKELTKYQGYGYEIATGARGYAMTAEKALKSWMGSSAHNDVIVNRPPWKNKWNAIGVGLYNGYAVVWFGNVVDN